MPSILFRSVDSILPGRVQRPARRSASLAAIAAAAALFTGQSDGATWINGGSNSTWGTSSNWSGGAIADGVGAIADFSTLDIAVGRSVSLGGHFTVGTLTFGDALTPSNNWTLANGTGGRWTLTLASSTGAPTISVVNQTTTISAILAGTEGFTKTGAGTLLLTNRDISLSGGISLNEGVLSFTSGTLGGNLVTVSGNAALLWANGNTQDVSAQIKIADGSIATLNSGANHITLATPIQVGPGESGGITKTGAGSITITGANTFTGGTRINVGRVVLAGGDNRLATTGAVTVGQGLNSGVLQLGDASGVSDQTVSSLVISGSGTGNAVVGGADAVSTLTINNSSAVTYGGLLGGIGANENNLAITKAGAGTLTFINADNSFNGGVTLTQGTLSFANGSLAANTITFVAASTLQWNGTNTQDISSRIKINDGVTATLDPGTNTVTLASPLRTGTSSTGSVTKTSVGTLILSAPNAWTGNTRVANGRLVLAGGDNRLAPTTSLQLGSGATSGILQLGDAAGPSSQTVKALSITGNASSVANAIVGGSSEVSTFTLNNTNAATFSGFLGGGGANENNLAFTKAGAGSLTLSGINTFIGDVAIEGGAVIIKNGAALGGGAKTVRIAAATNKPSLRLDGSNGDFTLAAGIGYVTSNDDTASPAIVNLSGNNIIAGDISLTTGGAGSGNTRIQVTGGSLSLAGAIAPATTALGAVALVLDGGETGVARGVLSDHGTIQLGVTKEGTGTWSLTGANSYSGATRVLAGRLNLTTAQTGGGAVSVSDGGILGIKLASEGESLSAASVTLGSTGATTLALDLGSSGNPSATVIRTGTLTLNGSITISIAALGLSVTDGVVVPYIPLFSYSTLGGAGFGSLRLGDLPARVEASLVNDAMNSAVKLNVSAFDIPRWTGAIDGSWNVDNGSGTVGTSNWKLSDGSATGYYQGGALGTDSVIFDDTAIGVKEVNLTTVLTPNTATVNTDATYTFLGAGKLSGTTRLLKVGPGKLILVNTGGNDYSGETTISEGVLAVGDGVTLGAGQLGTGPVVNNGVLDLNRPDDYNLPNVISGTGTVRKRAASSVTILGNNSGFDGHIEIIDGALKLGNANALGSSVGSTRVESTGVIDIAGFSIGENLLLNSGTVRASAGAGVLGGTVTLHEGGTFDVASGVSLTVSDRIEGFGGIAKRGPGTLIVSANSSYTGPTSILRGTLQFGASSGGGITGAPGSGDIVLSPADGNTATLAILHRDDLLVIDNTITSSGEGTNAIIIGVGGGASPSGTVTFSGNNVFTGNVTINAGALRITNSGALGSGVKTVTIANASRPGLVLDGSGESLELSSSINYSISSDGVVTAPGSAPGAIVNAAGDNVINGAISLINGGGGNGRIAVQGGALTLNGNIDANGATGVRTLFLGGPGAGLINGVISDFNPNAITAVGVIKDGVGEWSLAADNTFSGSLTVSGGVLKIGRMAGLGTAQPLGIASSAIVLGSASTSGTLEYTGAADTTLARPITVGGAAGGVLKSSGGGTLTLAGTVTRALRPLTLQGGAFVVSGQIIGAAADLNVDGAFVTLSQTTNNFVGTTNVFGGGVLRNEASEVLPNGSVLSLGNASDDSGGTYDLGGFNETVAGIASAGSGPNIITNLASGGASVLTVTGTAGFDGSIQDGPSAAVALTKNTGGVLTLRGANDYSGPTTVLEGTLLVSGSISGSSVTVHNGGSIGGNGIIVTEDQPFTLGLGGKLEPGLGLGTLTIDAGTAIVDISVAVAGSDTGALLFELGAVGLSDELKVTAGTLDIGDGLLNFDDFRFTAVPGFTSGTYTLFSSNSPIAGALDYNPGRLTGTIAGFDSTLALANGGQDLVLIVVPEPNAALVTLLGLGALASRRRRTRRPLAL